MICICLLAGCSLERKLSSPRELTIGLFTQVSCELSRYINSFRVDHPDIVINIVHDDDHSHDETYYDAELIQALQTGEIRVDLIVTESLDIYPLIKGNVIRDLSEVDGIGEALDNPRLLHGIRNLCFANGMMIGIPTQVNYVGYIVNKPLFEACEIKWTM